MMKVKVAAFFTVIIMLAVNAIAAVSDANTLFDRVVMKDVKRIALGSCSMEYVPQDYWDTIAKGNPNIWFWIGDSIYPNCTKLSCIKKSYKQRVSDPHYKQFVSSLLFMDGIWDDNDYGKNDGGKENENKQTVLKFFGASLNVTDPSRYTRPGFYSAHLIQVKTSKGIPSFIRFVFLDTRYNRDYPAFRQDREPYGSRFIELTARIFRITFGVGRRYNGTVLGPVQEEWLKNVLNLRTYQGQEILATFLISSVQIFTTMPIYESWGTFPLARDSLFHIIKEAKPKKLMFISGDAHMAQVDGSRKCVPEITTSGLTHSISDYMMASTLIRYILYPLYAQDWPEKKKDWNRWYLENHAQGDSNKFFFEKNFAEISLTPKSSGVRVTVSVLSLEDRREIYTLSASIPIGDSDDVYTCLNNAPRLIMADSRAAVIVACSLAGFVLLILLSICCCFRCFCPSVCSCCRRSPKAEPELQTEHRQSKIHRNKSFETIRTIQSSESGRTYHPSY